MAGEITGFTGVDDPYEVPENPELPWTRWSKGPSESLQNVLTKLARARVHRGRDPMVEGDRVHSGLTDLRDDDERPRRQGGLSRGAWYLPAME